MIDTRVRRKKNEQKNVVYNVYVRRLVSDNNSVNIFYTKTEIETLFFVGGVIKAIP